MKRAAALLLVTAILPGTVMAGGSSPALLGAGPGVTNPVQAHVDYMLKCQGCHRPDGSGNNFNTPPMTGEVARFLAVPGGRAFLARVPGVAQTDLDNIRLAQLLNWTLYRFDRTHVPADFKPYSAEEIGRLRKTPLRLDRVSMRARLIAAMQSMKSK